VENYNQDGTILISAVTNTGSIVSCVGVGYCMVLMLVLVLVLVFSYGVGVGCRRLF
jgi:hypothetical protein